MEKNSKLKYPLPIMVGHALIEIASVVMILMTSILRKSLQSIAE